MWVSLRKRNLGILSYPRVFEGRDWRQIYFTTSKEYKLEFWINKETLYLQNTQIYDEWKLNIKIKSPTGFLIMDKDVIIDENFISRFTLAITDGRFDV